MDKPTNKPTYEDSLNQLHESLKRLKDGVPPPPHKPSNVVDLARYRNQKEIYRETEKNKSKDENKTVEQIFAEVQQRNKENKERLEKERLNKNKNVVKAYELTKSDKPSKKD